MVGPILNDARPFPDSKFDVFTNSYEKNWFLVCSILCFNTFDLNSHGKPTCVTLERMDMTFMWLDDTCGKRQSQFVLVKFIWGERLYCILLMVRMGKDQQWKQCSGYGDHGRLCHWHIVCVCLDSREFLLALYFFRPSRYSPWQI